MFKLSNFTISGKILSHFKFDEKVLPGLKKQVVLKRNSWRNIFQLIRFIELWFTIFFKKSMFERWIHQSAKTMCLQIVEQF